MGLTNGSCFANHCGMEHPLRTYRRQRDITLDQLAVETGLSKSHLSEIEGGKRPGSKTIATLSEKTGLSPNSFFAPAPVRPTPSPDSSLPAVASTQHIAD